MWKDEYELGVPEIDNQHRRLFEMVEELDGILTEKGQEGEKKEKCKNAIIFMKAYVIMHFTDEEEYQKKIKSPRYEIHHKKHCEFTDTIRRYEEQLIQCNFDLQIIRKFSEELDAWLVEHVTGEDLLIRPGE